MPNRTFAEFTLDKSSFTFIPTQISSPPKVKYGLFSFPGNKNVTPVLNISDKKSVDNDQFDGSQFDKEMNLLSNALQEMPSLGPEPSTSGNSPTADDLSGSFSSPFCSQNIRRCASDSVKSHHRRVKTISNSSSSHRLPQRSNTISGSMFRPINASSYRSLPTSDAVSFLSSFAESSSQQLLQVAPDSEGEEVGGYVMGKLIGNGAFSSVREAYTSDPNTGEVHQLAVKIIRKDDTLDPQPIEDLILAMENEVVIWKQLHHPHILKFVDKIETDYAEFVFMELCPNGTLLDHVTNHKNLPESEARKYFLQLADAVRYLHQDAHVIHCDIKLENVVLAADHSARLSDFGLSQPRNLTTTSRPPLPAGSVTYCPPELLTKDCSSNSYPSDIWSLGVLLFAMVVGRFPFSDGFEPRLIAKIRSGNYTMPDDLSPALRSLLTGMLSTNPEDRPTISEILQSPWCTSSD